MDTKKVIIVDDNELSAEGIYKNIDWHELGAEVCYVTTNASEAADKIHTLEIDLIISDICMPGMNGLDLSKAVLGSKPYTKIILISAYDDFEFAKEAIRIGVCDYVEKPVDYAYLQQVAARVLKESEQEKMILQQLQQSRPAMIRKFYSELLETCPDDAEFFLADQAAYMGLDIHADEYICAVIQIDNFIEAKNTFGIERYHVLVMSLSAEVERSFFRYELSYTLTQGNNLMVILGNKTGSNDGFYSSVYKQFSGILDKYASSPLSLTIGIGDIVPSIWQVSSSCRNAKNAAGYRFIFGEGHIFNIHDIRRNRTGSAFFTAGTAGDEERLVRLISQKDLSGLRQFTDSLSVELADHYIDKNGIIACIYSMLARLNRFLYDTEVDTAQLQNSIKSMFADLDQFQTCAQICDRLYDICAECCSQLQESVQSQHNQIAGQVVSYIEDHYMNADMSIHDISSHLNISANYLGVLFKKVKGHTISDFITTVRIQKACELLSCTQLKIMEISEKVGYANPYYFSASFKKRTGRTPSEYRSADQRSLQ